MEAPQSYYLRCPVCEKETQHRILKGDVGTSGEEITIDGVIKCNECGHTRHKTLREKAAIDVPVIVSWKDDSDKKKISLYPDEWVTKGEELIVDGERAQVTSIEQEGNKRVDSSEVGDIETIWAKKHEKVRVKVAIHKGRNTVSETLEVSPDEEFFINDRLEAGKYDTVIYRMKTEDGVVKDGKAVADDIVRIYAKRIR